MDGAGGYQANWQAVIGVPPETPQEIAAKVDFLPSPTKPSGTKIYTRPRFLGDPVGTNYVNYAQASNPNDGIQFGNQANDKETNASGVTETVTSGISGPQTPARYIQWFNTVGYDHLLGAGTTNVPNVCPGGGMDLTNSSPLWTTPSSLQYQLLKRCQQIDPTVTPATLYVGNGSGLLEIPTLDLGESCFIYLDRNPSSATYKHLTITKTAPSWSAGWANQIADSVVPGAATPQSNLCYDNAWDPTLNNLVVDSEAPNPGCADCVPGSGDFNLHERPFMHLTNTSGFGTTFDGVQWNPSSGGQNGLLGELLLQNVTQATGNVAGWGPTFSGPN